MLAMPPHRSAAHLPKSFGTAPVPDIDGLRRAALQASWRRDRRVAQRRMAMRWALWYAIRGLPLMAIAAAVWFWVLPRPTENGLAPAHAPARQASPASSAAIAPARPAAQVQPAVKAASAKESPSPQLKPDNWLHSQEP